MWIDASNLWGCGVLKKSSDSVFGAVCLIAGTAVGAGALALPQLVAAVGVLWASGLLVATWFVVYVMSLYMAHLHISVGEDLSFTQVCYRLGGRGALVVATLSFFAIGYALMVAYMGALSSFWDGCVATKIVGLVLSLLVLSCSVYWIERLNRPLFVMVLVLSVCVVGGLCFVPLASFSQGPYVMHSVRGVACLIPVLFTSFGCQVVIGPVVSYFAGDQSKIRKAFFWGTLTPLCFYLLWIFFAANALCRNSPDLWALCARGGASSLSVSSVMEGLGGSLGGVFLRVTPLFSCLAVLTSLLGVGVGLVGENSAFLLVLQKHCAAALHG